jgi:hypothetical protein
MPKPFYGVDSNLLVEDLPRNFEIVEAILKGMFSIMALTNGRTDARRAF